MASVAVLALGVLFCNVLAEAIALLDLASGSNASELLLSISPINEVVIAVALLLAPLISTNEIALEELPDLMGEIRRDSLNISMTATILLQ